MRVLGVVALLSLWIAGCEPDAARLEGASCESDHDCPGLLCRADTLVPDDLATWPTVCKPRDTGAKPGSPCAVSSDCAHGLCLLAGACGAPCAQDTQCTNEERCAAVYARASADTLGSAHACVARVDLPDSVSVQSQRKQAALVTGTSSIELQPAAASTVYVLEHLSDMSWPVPFATTRCRPPLCAHKLSTRGAEPQLLFDLTHLPEQGPDNPVASGDYVNPLTVLLPNGPRSPAAPDGTTLEVEAKVAGDLRITRLQRADRGQRLDLNLYYVGAQDLSAAVDRGGPTLSAALEEVDRIFASADIFIGELRQIDVVGALLQRGAPLMAADVSRGFQRLRSQYQVLPQLPELFKLSAGAANVALDVFFVADIESSGGDVGGLAGGTPIPFGMHGTPGSGIVIAADMLSAQADGLKLGRTLAHELSHALGLFHTTEVDGSVFDPLPDTPVCPATRDADRNGVLDASECRDFGANNLMFPTSDASGTELSAEQIDVLQRALILQ